MIDEAKMQYQLTIHEGRKKKPYLDSVGKLTGGVGRNLDDVGFSDDEIELMLSNDIDKALNSAKKFSWWRDLDSVRQMVVVDMVFNLGLAGFAKFRKTVGFIGAGDYQKAASEMFDSKWADQVGPRALRLSNMMRSGDWDFPEYS